MQRKNTSALDPEFLTIYFMRGAQLDRKVAFRRVWLIFGGLLLIFGLLGLRVWQEMQVVKAGYQLNQMKKERLHLLEEQQVLQTQRNALASLERVELVARKDLGMCPPAKDQTVFMVESSEPRQGFNRVWTASQSWLERVADTWKAMTGFGGDKGKEGRLGG
jgi:cell division protein FtsL